MADADVTQTGPAFNPFDPDFPANPYEQYRALREADPVHRSVFGTVIAFRYDDVAAVLRNPTLSVEPANASPTLQMPTLQMTRLQEQFGERAERRRTILSLDPPDHTRLRRLVSKAFTPRMVAGLRPRIEQLVRELLNDIEGEAADSNGSVDLIARYAFPLPFLVISELLGMPEADRVQLREWSHTVTKSLEPILAPDDIDAVIAASEHMETHVVDAIRWKRDHPADDLLSGLIAAREGSDALTETELLDQVILLYLAGHETTVNLIGNGVWHLLRHRAELERLRADPTLDPNATEELLRYDSPVQFSRRITLADTVVADTEVEAGQFVMTALGSANHDPAHFGDDADALDLTRANAAEHVSFGSGLHFCLGAALARLEGQVAIGTLVRRFPALEAATDKPAWNGRLILRGLDELPVAVQ